MLADNDIIEILDRHNGLLWNCSQCDMRPRKGQKKKCMHDQTVPFFQDGLHFRLISRTKLSASALRSSEIAQKRPVADFILT